MFHLAGLDEKRALASETQVIDAIRKEHHELAFLELDLCRVALVRQMRHLQFDMREGNGFDRLSQGHVRLYDVFAVRHVERMTQKEVGIERYL